MIFIEYNGWGNESRTFQLDAVIEITPEDDMTRIVLWSSDPFLMQLSYDDFMSIVFSDRPYKENDLIRIDYKNPEPTTDDPSVEDYAS